MSADGDKPDFAVPHHAEAENAVLGAMLIDARVIPEVLSAVGPEAFYLHANRLIAEAVAELAGKDKHVDIVTLSEELSRRGLLDRVGGMTRLTALAESVPSAANVGHYLELVSASATLRRLIDACRDIERTAVRREGEADEIVDDAERRIYEIRERRLPGETLTLGQVLEETFDLIDTDRKGQLGGVDSGFYDLNDVTNGFQKKTLVILAARPSMGKSTLALNFALNAAETGVGVAFFSLEMTAQNIAQNMLCCRAQVESDRLRKGFLSREEKDKLYKAAAVISEFPIFIDESPSLTLMSLRAKARRLKARHAIGLVIVDYLQLIDPGLIRRSDTRQVEISQISRGLKALSRDLDLPVIALSQMSRDIEKRDDKWPRLADLRESGSIEQDADVVMFLHWDKDQWDQDRIHSGKVTLVVAKHRNGRTGPVPLTYQRDRFLFKSHSGLSEEGVPA